MLTVADVHEQSLAHRHGIHPGDRIITINHEKVLDDIDFQALTAKKHVCIQLLTPDGVEKEIDIIKSVSTPLGLQLDLSQFQTPKTCANHCIFCFVDQMPPGMRPSLYIKDDDWRFSLMMGNFITLTNVGDREFERILKRKVSPLYISVQATDPEARKMLLCNRNADKIMPRLNALAENHLSFHGQIVLCPGLNDGDILRKTLSDLYALFPYALSVACVPVGLTKFRNGLFPLKPYTREQAADVLDICFSFQNKAYHAHGTHFVFPADEFLSIAGHPIPPKERYDGFPQLENGIGMLRKLKDEMEKASMHCLTSSVSGRRIVIPTGTSAAPYLTEWIRAYGPEEANVRVIPVENHFFGTTVTVAGLLTATDILAALQTLEKDCVLICENMLNSDGTLFLDNISLEEFKARLHCPCNVIPNRGDALLQALTQA